MKNRKPETHKQDPILTEKVNLLYSKGTYNFFCKTCAIVFLAIIAILGKIKHVVDKLTKEEYRTLIKGIWVVNHYKRKLEGICSISSSVLDNMFCKCRMQLLDCICSLCYAHRQQSLQHGLSEHNIINGLILRNILLPVWALKEITIIFPYLRIESFGDVANATQARNYIRIIKAHPNKRCAIWSKNIAVWEKAFQMEGKPKNTTYVHSSRTINKPDEIDLDRYNFIDHIFTVYTKTYANKHNIVINCGGRKCLECILAKKACYYRNTELYINELKK